MQNRSRILLKLTGQIFISKKTGLSDSSLVSAIALQIKELLPTHQFAIVTGGGNLFRGNQQGKQFSLTPWTAHTCGMLATLMNGLMLQDILRKAQVKATLLSAIYCPEVAYPINQHVVDQALANNDCIIFAGGTGNPYFTTDTNAVLRALEIDATEIWKCTSVDGVYESDPAHNPDAKLMKTITYTQALAKNIAIMDSTAFTLAHDNDLTIRVFNIFKQNAIMQAAQERSFGTVIQR